MYSTHSRLNAKCTTYGPVVTVKVIKLRNMKSKLVIDTGGYGDRLKENN